MKNIVLVGFMGAGKTVTSKTLAAQLGAERVSTDDAIIAKEGRPINAIFEEDGEAYFRNIEAQVVQELSGRVNLIIDCGGGVVLRRENIDALKTGGLIFYLKTSSDVVYARVKHEKHRPLLNVDDPVARINEMLNVRENFYQQADYTVMTDGKTAEEVAGEIIEIAASF